MKILITPGDSDYTVPVELARECTQTGSGTLRSCDPASPGGCTPRRAEEASPAPRTSPDGQIERGSAESAEQYALRLQNSTAPFKHATASGSR